MFRNPRFSKTEKRPFRGPKPKVEESSIRTEKIQIERKSFQFSLNENPRGRFLRVTEDVNGRRDTIIIPATGLEDFHKTIGAMIQASEQAEISPDPASGDSQ